jgi:hypothetical protein
MAVDVGASRPREPDRNSIEDEGLDSLLCRSFKLVFIAKANDRRGRHASCKHARRCIYS